MFQHLKDLINHKFNCNKTPKIILANISYCIVYTYMNYSEEFGGVQNFLKKYFEVENHLYLFKFL